MNAQTPIPIPPGREAIAAAIETLIAVLDAMTPDPDLEAADDTWEGDIFEDMEPDDHYGGDVCDEPHDQDMEVTLLSQDAHTTGRSWDLDQRFIVTDHGLYIDELPVTKSEAWPEATRVVRTKRGNRVTINGRHRLPPYAPRWAEGK